MGNEMENGMGMEREHNGNCLTHTICMTKWYDRLKIRELILSDI